MNIFDEMRNVLEVLPQDQAQTCRMRCAHEQGFVKEGEGVDAQHRADHGAAVRGCVVCVCVRSEWTHVGADIPVKLTLHAAAERDQTLQSFKAQETPLHSCK